MKPIVASAIDRAKTQKGAAAMDTFASDDILAAIKRILAEIAPDIRYLPKYGGEVLAPDPDNDASFVGGMFVYKDHVSLEFSTGATFDDPGGLLEGGGKLRRHLKLRTPQEVDSKDARAFLRQALGA